MSDLGTQLQQLGLSHYYEAFVAEGFDTWQTVLDITESDLNSLNVKLGHRRKLQRAIAETRGHYPDRALPLFTNKSANADNSYRSDDSNDMKSKKGDGTSTASGTSTKRKYRRHPKPDEHAPERPASAYVIFSNQMREELKGQELSFTEIAKVVGERWQVLSPESRENFEREANAAKEKYYAELTEYKKTPQYADYQEYLKDFKAKHAPTQNEGKRSKLESEVSTSSQLATFDSSDRRRISHSESQGSYPHIERSESDPPGHYHIPGARPLPLSATSPATNSFSAINSPKAMDQHSPMSVSPRSSVMREPYENHHAANTMTQDGKERYSDSSLPGLSLPPIRYHNQSSASSTPPSVQQQTHRDLPRRGYREPNTVLPPLTREDTTLSSDSASVTSVQQQPPPAGAYQPVNEVTKNARALPQPNLKIGPSFDSRASAGLTTGPDPRPGASSIAALLQADAIITRDTDISR